MQRTTNLKRVRDAIPEESTEKDGESTKTNHLTFRRESAFLIRLSRINTAIGSLNCDSRSQLSRTERMWGNIPTVLQSTFIIMAHSKHLSIYSLITIRDNFTIVS